MEMRDRLIELMEQGVHKTPCEYDEDCDCTGVKCDACVRGSIADHLLANGVIVPPCRVGDTVYCKYWNGGFVKCTVSMITQQVDKPLKLRLSANGSVSIEYTVNDLGKLVFLTKEEAEKALKEREGNG